MFVRKVYYDRDSGDVVAMYSMDGAISAPSQSQDEEIFASIKDNPSILCLVWNEKDQEIEEGFSRCTGFTVDVSGPVHRVKFDYTPLPEPVEYPDPATMEKTLNELGVQTRWEE